MHSSRTLVFLFLCMFLLSCGDASKREASEAEEKVFVETYVRLARAAQEHGEDPESLAVIQETIFQEAGLNREEYAALARKLEASPERWAVIWERIVDRLQQEEKKEGG